MGLLCIALLLLSVYSYTIYPIVVFVLSVLKRNPWQQDSYLPGVSIIVSVFNEEAVIEKKIRNALTLNYPSNLLEIIISSDGSTDSTHQIVKQFTDPRVVLKSFDRLGKTACLNNVVPDAKGEIVIFTDANSMFPRDVVNKIVRNFSDRNVGLVTGSTVYLSQDGEEDITGIYAKLEKWTKYRESLVSSCVGADGAIFAIRRVLYKLLSDTDINDFVIPLGVVSQNRRVVLDSSIYCFEETADGGKSAFRRQVRITTRTLWAILRNIKFINPKQFGWFSFFFVSHKVLRLLTPFFIIGAFLTNLILLTHSVFFILTFLLMLFFISCGVLNATGVITGRISRVCNMFLITQAAQITAWIRLLLGIEDKIWTPQR